MGLPYLSEARDTLRSRLWEQDVYTSTIWDKLHPLVHDGRHGHALQLARRILTLRFLCSAKVIPLIARSNRIRRESPYTVACRTAAAYLEQLTPSTPKAEVRL